MSLIKVDNIESTGGTVSILSNLKLQTVPAGTSINNLGIDASGLVVIGTSGGGGVFVTGGTYSNGTLDLIDSAGTLIPVTGFYTGGTFVESISDDGNGIVIVDNTDPLNPIVIFTGITTDGVTVSGTGLAGSPLTVIGGGGSFTGGTINGATIFTNGLTANTITSNTITATTITSDKFYGDGSNLAGVVGLTYSDLGFTITSPTPTTINQDVVLPYNSDVTYPTELVIDDGYSVTIPSGTTLTIL
jgi:hypothetical protein